MVAMGTEVDRNSKSIKNHRDDDFQKLELDYKNLQEKTQNLSVKGPILSLNCEI